MSGQMAAIVYITANSALRASLAIYHLISNAPRRARGIIVNYNIFELML